MTLPLNMCSLQEAGLSPDKAEYDEDDYKEMQKFMNHMDIRLLFFREVRTYSYVWVSTF